MKYLVLIFALGLAGCGGGHGYGNTYYDKQCADSLDQLGLCD